MQNNAGPNCAATKDIRFAQSYFASNRIMEPASVISCDLCCAYMFSFGFFLQDISTNTNLLKGPPYPSGPGTSGSKSSSA